MTAKPADLSLEVAHAATGERRLLKYVAVLSLGRNARAVVLLWPEGGEGVFCAVSGWELELEAWRLTVDARARAAELVGPTRAEREPKPIEIDPRQTRLPFR